MRVWSSVIDWLRPLKLFWDLHIFRHVHKYVNDPEITLKQLQNNSKTFWNCFSVLFHILPSEGRLAIY